MLRNVRNISLRLGQSFSTLSFQNRAYSSEAPVYAKRFYKDVTIEKEHTIPVPTNSAITLPKADYYNILLDGRKVKTPGGLALCVPTEKLALTVANEWDSQDSHLLPYTMHMTSLSFTAIEKQEQRTERIKELIGFLGSDTLCYRHPAESKLYELQLKNWDPIVKWFEDSLNVELCTTTNLSLQEHPAKTFEVGGKILRELNHWSFTGFEQAIAITHSFVLPYAGLTGHISSAKALSIANTEAEFQRSIWGNIEDEDVLSTEDKLASLSSALLFSRWTRI